MSDDEEHLLNDAIAALDCLLEEVGCHEAVGHQPVLYPVRDAQPQESNPGTDGHSEVQVNPYDLQHQVHHHYSRQQQQQQPRSPHQGEAAVNGGATQAPLAPTHPQQGSLPSLSKQSDPNGPVNHSPQPLLATQGPAPLGRALHSGSGRGPGPGPGEGGRWDGRGASVATAAASGLHQDQPGVDARHPNGSHAAALRRLAPHLRGEGAEAPRTATAPQQSLPQEPQAAPQRPQSAWQLTSPPAGSKHEPTDIDAGAPKIDADADGAASSSSAVAAAAAEPPRVPFLPPPPLALRGNARARRGSAAYMVTAEQDQRLALAMERARRLSVDATSTPAARGEGPSQAPSVSQGGRTGGGSAESGSGRVLGTQTSGNGTGAEGSRRGSRGGVEGTQAPQGAAAPAPGRVLRRLDTLAAGPRAGALGRDKGGLALWTGNKKKVEQARLAVRLLQATGLCRHAPRPEGAAGAGADADIDPFAVVSVEERRYTSKAVMKSKDPFWDEFFVFDVRQPAFAVLKVKVYDHLRCWRPAFMGHVRIPVKSIAEFPARYAQPGWHPLALRSRGGRVTGQVQMQIFYTAEWVHRPLRVLAGTWNVGNAEPPADLGPWLQGVHTLQHDLVALGVQECLYKGGGGGGGEEVAEEDFGLLGSVVGFGEEGGQDDDALSTAPTAHYSSQLSATLQESAEPDFSVGRPHSRTHSHTHSQGQGQPQAQGHGRGGFKLRERSIRRLSAAVAPADPDNNPSARARRVVAGAAAALATTMDSLSTVVPVDATESGCGTGTEGGNSPAGSGAATRESSATSAGQPHSFTAARARAAARGRPVGRSQPQGQGQGQPQVNGRASSQTSISHVAVAVGPHVPGTGTGSVPTSSQGMVGGPSVFGSAAGRRRHSVAVMPAAPQPYHAGHRASQGSLPSPIISEPGGTVTAGPSFSASGAHISAAPNGRRGSVVLHNQLLQQHLLAYQAAQQGGGGGSSGGGGAGPPPASVKAVQQTYKAQGVLQGVTDVAKVGGDFKEMWEERIKEAVGSGYFMVASAHMGQIRLLLFARNDIYAAISDVRTGKQATGVAGVATNKGGVGISLRVWDTSMAFVNTHLAAHQDKTRARNNNYRDIIRGLKLDPQGSSMDVLTAFHHVVWMGDLNYRLDWGQQAVTHSESPTAADFASLVGEVQKGAFAKLLEFDQLRKEVAAQRAFLGFNEGDIGFEPSFKVLRKRGHEYNPQRSPAYCDRILFRSNLPLKQIRALSYFSPAEIATSDHKPVGAVLLVPTIWRNTVEENDGAAAGGGGGGGRRRHGGAAHSQSPLTRFGARLTQLGTLLRSGGDGPGHGGAGGAGGGSLHGSTRIRLVFTSLRATGLFMLRARRMSTMGSGAEFPSPQLLLSGPCLKDDVARSRVAAHTREPCWADADDPELGALHVVLKTASFAEMAHFRLWARVLDMRGAERSKSASAGGGGGGGGAGGGGGGGKGGGDGGGSLMALGVLPLADAVTTLLQDEEGVSAFRVQLELHGLPAGSLVGCMRIEVLEPPGQPERRHGGVGHAGDGGGGRAGAGGGDGEAPPRHGGGLFGTLRRNLA